MSEDLVIEETLEEEMRRANPRMFWGARKIKRYIRNRANHLFVGSYAIGCRGHPGIVIDRCYWPNWSLKNLFGASVGIKSLVDDVEEDCSIYACGPMSITRQEAERRVHDIKTLNIFDMAYKNGTSLEYISTWYHDWMTRGLRYHVLTDRAGYTIRSAQAFTQVDAEEYIKEQKGRETLGYTNVRMVDILEYPAPIQSEEILEVIKKDKASGIL